MNNLFSTYRAKGKIDHKHLLTLKDYSQSDIFEILKLALALKPLRLKGKKNDLLRGKTLAMIFSKASTR
ncbi:MAG: ornithine carbamoyltransferase, partial [Firmicutes bacterium]|nr:ornithine carbamoyltransferase [Bacillota bacterium]